MHLNISINSSLPEITNVIIGSVGDSDFYLDLDSATQEQKDIVSNFVNLVGKNIIVNIENLELSDHFISDIVISEPTTLDEVTIDYNSLSISDKLIVDAYVLLIEELNL